MPCLVEEELQKKVETIRFSASIAKAGRSRNEFSSASESAFKSDWSF